MKRFLFIALVATVVSMVAAASASAAVWKDKGVNVTSHFTIGLTGGEVIEVGSKILTCEIHATLQGEAGSTGKITQFETKKCTGAGELAKCQLATSEAKGLPWSLSVTVGSDDMAVSNWRNRRTFKSGCVVSELDKTLPAVLFDFDSTAAISSMEFEGVAVGVKNFGSFTVDVPNAGTYGIG